MMSLRPTQPHRTPHHGTSLRVLLPCLTALVLAALLVAPGLWASSYVMTTDGELVERANVIVLGRVIAAEPALGTSLPQTEYFIEVEEVLKGYVTGNTIPVRVLGGNTRDGRALRVSGMPRFATEEAVLLFLKTGDSGGFTLTEHALGAFREVRRGDQRLVTRNLNQANLVTIDGDPRAAERKRAHLPRDRAGFVSWIRSRVADPNQGSAAASYFVEDPTGNDLSKTLRVEERFNLSGSPAECGSAAGSPLRFFGFESGAAQRYRPHASGSPGVSGGGIANLTTSARAWNQHTGSEINIIIGNTTSVTDTSDTNGLNQILFEDPTGEMDGSFTGSGTLAVNFAWFGCGRQSFVGGRAHVIVESDIITQDGFGENYVARSSNPTKAFEEVIAHEMGHGIGLAHSCGDPSPACTGNPGNALMNPFAHDDGRGASLGSDDKAGAAFLYGASSGEGPEAPSGLEATALSTSEIQLTWTDNSVDETGFEIEEKTAKGEYTLIASLDANTTTLTVTGLAPASYRSYRVAARNTSGLSDFSNEASATSDGLAGQCSTSSTRLCLNEDRFSVTADYEFPDGRAGSSTAHDLTSDTGYFTYLDPSNVEIVIKVLNGCTGFNTYWVFAAGLTNVEIVMTVIDTETGKAKTYFNPLNQAFAPIQDIQAFATCP